MSKLCRIAAGAVVFVSGPTVGLAACDKMVSWRSDPPYLVRQADGVINGIHADLIRESFRRMDCKVHFVEMPFARSLVELQAGRIDIVSGVADTPERKAYAWFSRPINFARNVLFIQKKVATQLRIRRLRDIIGTDFRLGALNQALYGGDYDDLVADPGFRDRLTIVTSRASGWKMMGVKHLDGLIDNELAGLAELRSDGYRDDVIESDLVISEGPDLLAFSKKTTPDGFVARFNDAYAGMIADGTFKSIFSRYAGCEISTVKLGCK